MHIVLFDEPDISSFLPLAYTRPTGDLRCGIFTNRERWMLDEAQVSFRCAPSLQQLFPERASGPALYANGRVIWDEGLRTVASGLQPGEVLVADDVLLAYSSDKPMVSLEELVITGEVEVEDVILLNNIRDLFIKNAEVLALDFEEVTEGRVSQPLSETNTLIGNPDQLYIEHGAWVEASIINVENGPVYIGKDCQVMEGCLIRGGMALCEGAQLKMGSKIYGASTFGPQCRVGGEVSNSVFQGYSNKGHDGFVGNSVLGQWCNLGADTNTSNLKNNYGPVKVWDYQRGSMEDSGLTFCGLIMGDHSKCSINTQFNTGTTIGVNANVFGHGFPPKFVPSWSWGGSDGFSTYDLDKSYEVARRVCARRKVKFDALDEQLMARIFEDTAVFRD